MPRIHKSNMVLNIFVLVTIMAEVIVEENSKIKKSGQVVEEEIMCEGRGIFEGTFKKALPAPAVFLSGPHHPPLPPPPQHPNQLFPEACLA